MRTVKWGILGTARIAREQLIPALQREGHSEVVAIASKSGKARDVADRFGIPAAYDDYEALLGDPAVEAVYIPLPNGLHKEWAIKAARHGKHVLCEKPSALTSAETREILEACREHDVIFMEGFMYRHHPQHQRVKEIMQSGEIGEVVLFRASLHFLLEDVDGISAWTRRWAAAACMTSAATAFIPPATFWGRSRYRSLRRAACTNGGRWTRWLPPCSG